MHIYLIRLLIPTNGNVTCTDRFTCWVEVIPLPDITVETVSKAFQEHRVCRIGAPSGVIVDYGRQFELHFRNLAAVCGTKVLRTTPYHSECNDKLEKFHGTLKTAVKVHININWTEVINNCTFKSQICNKV